MNAKFQFNIFNTDFIVSNRNLQIKRTTKDMMNLDINIMNVNRLFDDNKLRINNFIIEGCNNSITIEDIGNAEITIVYKDMSVKESDNVNLSINEAYAEIEEVYTTEEIIENNSNVKNEVIEEKEKVEVKNEVIEVKEEVKVKKEEVVDPVSKLIESNRKAKRERMRNFGVVHYENVNNLSNQDKEEILNGNLKLMKANNELLILLNKCNYTLNSRSDKDYCKIIMKKSNDELKKKQYNSMEELMEINKENLKLFCKYEELQKCKVKPIKKAKAQSLFLSSTPISDELAVFLGKSIGTKMSRVDVSKAINAYIRVNKLQDKNNGRIINCNEQLRNLLKVKPTDELTYFNLQKYLAPHFKKA